MGKFKIALTSGFYNPLHEGHIECFKLIKEFSDYLIVFVDSDEKAFLKHGYIYIPEKTRLAVVESNKYVNYAEIVNTPISKAIERFAKKYSIDYWCKGGDRTIDNLPPDEIDVCNHHGIQIICGLGEKINSSSEINKRIKG